MKRLRPWITPEAGEDSGLKEPDNELLLEAALEEARRHVRKLRGLEPYSLPEVKPAESLRHLCRLLCIVRHLQESRSLQERKRLVEENQELRGQLYLCEREMRRWQLRVPKPRRPCSRS